MHLKALGPHRRRDGRAGGFPRDRSLVKFQPGGGDKAILRKEFPVSSPLAHPLLLDKHA